MINIKVINPIILTKVDWQPLMEKAYCSAHDPDTQLDFVFLPKGIESPEQHFWESLQMTFLMQELERVDQETADGVVIFCAADPGVVAAKEYLHIPVVGILETSVALATLLGRRFTWLSPLKCGDGLILDRIHGTGNTSRLASLRSIEVPVAEMDEDGDLVRDRTIAEGRRAIEEDGADTLIIGCTGMMGLAEDTQRILGVPVIDAGVAGIRMCEMLIKMDLSQSKHAFPTPRKNMKRRVD